MVHYRRDGFLGPGAHLRLYLPRATHPVHFGATGNRAREHTMSEHDRDIEMQAEYDFSEATQGPVIPPAPGKTRITIRLDNDILDWFRAQVHRQGGGNYQTLINQALRQYMQAREGRPIEEDVKSISFSLAREDFERIANMLMELRSAVAHAHPLREERLRQVMREELQRAS
jgi:uncharacterized protein (DUF4415 family)